MTTPSVAEFRALLSVISTQVDITDSEDLRMLALGASGHQPDDPLEAVDPIRLTKDGPVPGDLLVRRAPGEGVTYLAVIVGDQLESADMLAGRGVTVETAGPGLYVEVAEVPFGRGTVEVSARKVTDRWGRSPRRQTVYRPRSESPAPGDDDEEALFESEELARHAAYGVGVLPYFETVIEADETGRRPTILTSARLRQAWSAYDCAEGRMTQLRLFGRWSTPVNPETVDAWRTFERTLLAAGYQPHRAWVYNCRQIAGQQTHSLHAYGLAIDIDHAEPVCNVNRPTPDGRAVRFSAGETKEERCHDVRRGVADTNFTAEQVAAIEDLQTVDGHQVFAWGGRWRLTKDTMHFQINVTPAELARGIRPDSVHTRAPAETSNSGGALLESVFAEDVDYTIEGGKYTPEEKKRAATHPAGLILTASVIGRFERRVTDHAPYTLSVSKEWTRFGSGRLGEFVTDYNDFTHYFGEVLAAIGRLQDLLSAGSPEIPDFMTSRQKQALKPTTDRPEDTDKKILYRQWRDEQAKYASTQGGVARGLVFDVAHTANKFDVARHGFWQTAGDLKRTIAEAKRLGKNKPVLDVLDLSLSDALALVDPYALAAKGVDLVVDAVQKRKEYDEKMALFAARVGETNDEIKDKFEKLRDVEKSYWTALRQHRESIGNRERTRLEARQKAALLGQKLAPPGETRPAVLAEIRMPVLVADAWWTLAVVGPPARAKLAKTLRAQQLIEEASKRDWSWRPKVRGGPPSDPFADISQIRLAWQRADSWRPVLTKEAITDWRSVNTLWDEVFTKFNV